jgi:hypothetical protein
MRMKEVMIKERILGRRRKKKGWWQGEEVGEGVERRVKVLN